MQQKKVLKSGSILMLDYTNFANSMELLQALASIINSEFGSFKLDSKFLENGFNFEELIDNLDKGDVKGSEGLVLKMLEILTRAIANGSLVETIIKCGDTSTLDDRRINKELFEDVNQRQNMFEVLFEIAKYNLKPFFPKAAIK